jgi:hypothetical protein
MKWLWRHAHHKLWPDIDYCPGQWPNLNSSQLCLRKLTVIQLVKTFLALSPFSDPILRQAHQFPDLPRILFTPVPTLQPVQLRRYVLDGSEFESRKEKILLPLPRCADRLWGPQNVLFNKYEGSLQETKLSERHTSSSAEVKNEWSLAYTPFICPLGVERNSAVKQSKYFYYL